MRLGSYEAKLLSDGSYRLDGGGMFGVVPKVLWERSHPPDQHNRVELALHCLLLKSQDKLILVDTGLGQGYSDREMERYAVARPRGGLMEDLARHGVAAEDVSDVILTHLHFDHAGGSVLQRDGEWRPSFPNATYWVQGKQLQWAKMPTERDRAAFRKEHWAALLAEEGRLRLLDGESEFLPQIRSLLVNGHSPGQQLLLIGDEQQRLLFCGDLIPFASQLRIPYIMAFDLHPLLTMAEKKEVLARASTESWALVFQHDPVIKAATIRAGDSAFEVDEELEL